jgi:hypothetical protein
MLWIFMTGPFGRRPVEPPSGAVELLCVGGV